MVVTYSTIPCLDPEGSTCNFYCCGNVKYNTKWRLLSPSFVEANCCHHDPGRIATWCRAKVQHNPKCLEQPASLQYCLEQMRQGSEGAVWHCTGRCDPKWQWSHRVVHTAWLLESWAAIWTVHLLQGAYSLVSRSKTSPGVGSGRHIQR